MTVKLYISTQWHAGKPGDDFYNFMYNAHPKLCDHCIHAHNIQNGMINKPWDFTKRDIKEWMVD